MPRATNCAIPRMLYFCVIFHDNHVWLLYHSFHKLSRYSSAIMHGLPFYTFLSNLITAKRDHAIRMIPNFKNKKDHDFAQTALHFISKCANTLKIHLCYDILFYNIIVFRYKFLDTNNKTSLYHTLQTP